MASSTKAGPKSGNVAQFPAQEAAVSVAEAPEPSAEGIEAAIPAEFQTQTDKRIGRPKKTDAPIETDFFRQVAAVPAADWGTPRLPLPLPD